MRYVTLAFLLMLLGATTGPAAAGGHHPYWRDSDCCAGTFVRAPVRYLRLVEQLPYCAYCDNPPVRYVPAPEWPAGCVVRPSPVAVDRGGWILTATAICY